MPPAEYTVDFSRLARRHLAALPREVAQRLVNRAQDLGRDPFPEDCARVKGLGKKHEVWRVREGNYRIAYQVFTGDKQIVIVGIATRGSIYQILKQQFG